MVLFLLNERVGLAAVEALAEPIMQSTLNSFHYSGSSHMMTSSYQRLKGLLVGSSKEPIRYRIPSKDLKIIPEVLLKDILIDVQQEYCVLKIPKIDAMSPDKIVERIHECFSSYPYEVDYESGRITLIGMNPENVIEFHQCDVMNGTKNAQMIGDTLITNSGVFVLHELLEKDPSCYSSSIAENLHLFGVEVAREVFLKEIKEVLHGKKIQEEYLEIIADFIFYPGDFTPLTFFGLHNQNISVLQKAAIHRSFYEMLKAGVENTQDSVEDLTSRIMLGQ